MLINCAPKGYTSHSAGFFEGLWHGFIIVFSVTGKKIGIYASHNTGVTYWLRFIIELCVSGVSGNSARHSFYKII